MPVPVKSAPQPVKLVTHDPTWASAAANESARLRLALDIVCLDVLHLGSTAVPGIVAKPTIDLFPVVTHLAAVDGRRRHIEALGYNWRGDFGIAGRRFCTHDAAGARLFNVHVFENGSPEIARHRNFHAYLRAHSHEARAYQDVKLTAAQLHPDDTLRYNDWKSSWIQACELRAKAWFEATATVRQEGE
jgi:GrpB-like predicted nucleotidyltransferase (UPF0157 family)